MSSNSANPPAIRSSRANAATRLAANHAMTGLAVLGTIVVLVPLVAILVYLIYKGASSLNVAFFTHTPRPVGEAGGGMANSIVGSGIVLSLASLLGIPVGIAGGVYLAEYGAGKPLGGVIRFVADVLNGVPSIVMGIVGYALVVVHQHHFSALAGGITLAIMMIPTVTRTTEEMLLTVPHSIREAAYGLGVPRWRTILSISLRTALPGIITGLHAGLRARRGRDGSAAVHRVRQPVLAPQPERTHRRAAAADLHLRAFAL